MSSWTPAEFLDEFKVQLDARVGLTGLTPTVTVYTHDPTLAVSSTDAIVLGPRVFDVNDPETLGRLRYDELVNVECFVLVLRPGAGEAVAKEARDRATTLLEQVDSQLRTDPPAVGDQTIKAQILNREMTQYAAEVGDSATPVRVCSVDFTIQYQARTTAA